MPDALARASPEQEPVVGETHEIAIDQQRRRGVHRPCGGVHLLRRGVSQAVKHSILAGWAVGSPA